MKIAILGSAPSSLGLAPFGNPAWKIWGCSPGVYAAARRCDAWFELHRWEPPTIGVPESQKQWFSPEYVAWMAMRVPGECPVWMYEPVPEIPASRALPVDDLLSKYGSYFFTSSIAWMLACAMEDILEERAANPGAERDDAISLFGVDMAANEEYGYQRAGCQHFLLMAAELGIQIYVPPESDLLRPMPLYGICESSHWMIKGTVRRRELEARLAGAQQAAAQATQNVHFLSGALDDANYHLLTWGEDREGMGPSPLITSQSPRLRGLIREQLSPVIAAEERARMAAEAATRNVSVTELSSSMSQNAARKRPKPRAKDAPKRKR